MLDAPPPLVAVPDPAEARAAIEWQATNPRMAFTSSPAATAARLYPDDPARRVWLQRSLTHALIKIWKEVDR